MGWDSGVGAESCGRQPGLEDRYRMPRRGVVPVKWPGGTEGGGGMARPSKMRLYTED